MPQPQNLPDNDTYLRGIRNGDDATLRRIYDEFQEGIVRYVISQGGSREDAEDVFEVALVAIFEKLQEGELKLKAPFGAYLFRICQNQWLKLFRSKRRISGVTEAVERVLTDEEDGPDGLLERQMLRVYMREVFDRLQEDCRRLLRQRWDGSSYEAIRQAMGYGSEAYTRRRKHVCQERLKELIENDSRIREFFVE